MGVKFNFSEERRMNYSGQEFWKRATEHLKLYPDAAKTKQNPVDKERKERERLNVEGFLRSGAFDAGISLVEAVLGKHAYMEVFVLDRRRGDEKQSVMYQLGRCGFQRISISTECSVSCAPVSVDEAVASWLASEEFDDSHYPLIKLIRDRFDSFAEPICDEYD